LDLKFTVSLLGADVYFQVVESCPFRYTYEDGDWLAALIIFVFAAAAQHLLLSSSTSTCAQQLTSYDGHGSALQHIHI
jgi:hypothetical protein